MGQSKQSNSQTADVDLIDAVNIVEIDAIGAAVVNEEKIYIRKISGYFKNLRRYISWPLLIAFFALPWFSFDGKPLVFFDLVAQKFHIFGLSFWPQDGILLAWILIIAAFALFAFTAWLGRVWCGFTCPQTIWTLIFVYFEDLFEGDRNQRIKLDNSKWDANKIARKSAKHVSWLLVSFLTGFTFIAYFYPATEMATAFLDNSAPGLAYFWVGFFLVCTYANAGFLRQQVCKHMCPYARFQSVMYDADTLLISYDQERGEPRAGHLKKQAASDNPQTAGSCVDCSWCVQVCPVGIDIRDGLQYACIDCGLCIDACDQVMEKTKQPKGLIRFVSENELSSGVKKVISAKTTAYFACVLIMLAVFAQTLSSRETLTLDVVRDRAGALYHLRGENIENVYRVKINNLDTQAHTYQLSVSGSAQQGYQLQGKTLVSVEPGEVYILPVRLSLPQSQIKTPGDEISFVVSQLIPVQGEIAKGTEQGEAIEQQARQSSRFISPMQR